MTNAIANSIITLLQVISPVSAPATVAQATFNPADLVIPAVQVCISKTGPLLQLGTESPEVKRLQQILNIAPDTRIATSGPGAPGNETGYFGPKTEKALKIFQQKYPSEILVPASVTKGTGVAGLYTRSKAQQICNTISSSGMTQKDFTQAAPAAYAELLANKSGGSKTPSTGGSSKPVTIPSVVAPTATVSSRTTSVNGSCGVTVNSCTAGSFRNSRDSSSLYKWSCVGISRGKTASCSMSKTATATTTTPTPAPTTTPTVPKPTPTPTTTPTTPTTPTVPSTSSTLEWGAFSGYSPSDLTSFESLVGKQVKIKAVFTNWDDEFPTYATPGLKDANKTLLIFWEQYGVTLDSIIAGNSDAYIREFAAAAKSYGGKIILSPFHEMNGNWDPWGGTVGQNTPEKVVEAWRHIHTVFGSVSNVKWAWAVNNDSVPDTAANAIQKYYPGDAYTDYVAVDGFNFGSPWKSFDALFAKSLGIVSAYKKPIYILSMGSAGGSAKAAWITDAFGVQVKKYPLLKGWVWFNENKEQDWRVNSDAASLVAFKAILP